MMRGVGWYRVGFAMLGCLAVLAACSGGSFFAEREPWRKEAEARCISSGAVREGPGIARIGPISGPGTCGADYPLKVSSLGQPGLLGYGEELRPPGTIPNAARQMPRWPVRSRPRRRRPLRTARRAASAGRVAPAAAAAAKRSAGL